jgi:hypothetical protein
MPSPESKSLTAVGNVALGKAVGIDLTAGILRRVTYTGGSREREFVRDEEGVRRVEHHLPAVYAPPENEGVLGHVAFALKHEVPLLGLLTATFRHISPAEVGAYVAASPTGAYARRIGFLYEFLTGTDLSPHLQGVTIGGNYADLVDPTKVVVTGDPVRDGRWRIFNNLPGTRDYIPLIERTAAVEKTLKHDWHKEVSDALAVENTTESLLKRALSYLYRKETRSSFEIERENPSEARAARFVEALKQAGQGSAADALSQETLTSLQNLIVDTRFAERTYRSDQNYVGSVIRRENVVHYVPPPPSLLPTLMPGLMRATASMGQEPLAQAAVASFGLVFHHPFDDGNGRLHRYLLHDFMARSKVIPGGMALPVSAAILSDMQGYDHALEAYSKTVAAVAEYKLSDRGELTVTNPDAAAWVWRFPDLTPQVEFLGRTLAKSVRMVAEEVSYLVKYDALAEKAKALIDMPDRRMSDLLVLIDENNGRLSNNKHKQRFPELRADEIAAVEAAYVEIFGRSVQRSAAGFSAKSSAVNNDQPLPTPKPQPKGLQKR